MVIVVVVIIVILDDRTVAILSLRIILLIPFDPLTNTLPFCINFPYHDIDLEEKKRLDKTCERARSYVGRVLFDKKCQGSCVLVEWLQKTYILTCRHVVFDEGIGIIPMNHLSCLFGKESYSRKKGNLQYLGSTNSELDLAFFLVDGTGNIEGFELNIDVDIYQGQPIMLAGFPIALADLEGKLVSVPKIQSGRVAAAGSFHDIAFGDISGSMPNTSGGAIVSTTDGGKSVFGIHEGVAYHEDLSNKVGHVIEKQIKIKREKKYLLQKDPETAVSDGSPNATPEKSKMPDLKELDISKEATTVSPEGKTRSRGLYASANIPQKGAMSYFATNKTIAAIFSWNEKIFGEIGETAQSTVAKTSQRKRKA